MELLKRPKLNALAMAVHGVQNLENNKSVSMSSWDNPRMIVDDPNKSIIID